MYLERIKKVVEQYQERLRGNIMEDGRMRWEYYNVQRRIAQAAYNYNGYIVTGTRHSCPIMEMQIMMVEEVLEEWYDLTYRIPHCLFSELEKFIEQEKGLETHEWEKTLTFDECWGMSPNDENYGKLTHQAIPPIEQQEIYNWWKENKGQKDVDFENEETYLEQEEEMLIRLIKIRNSLWT